VIRELDNPGLAVPAILGSGALDQLGPRAVALGGQRVLLVSDPGVAAAGHVARAAQSLQRNGIDVRIFDQAEQNPTTHCVDKAVAAARDHGANLIVGLGGGSSMDCAKGCNFIFSNGGRMQDYWGVGKATKPMLPLIAIPTTAGTGSEAQSFALITDPATHQKMACGDKKALPKLAILDPDLTATQPARVAADTAIDAVAHAVESVACTKRNAVSRALAKEAWRLLSKSFEEVLHPPGSVQARGNMLLGAHLAGAAIEQSMLGAAHAAANPLTAMFGIVHGSAVGLMLPHVIRFNASGGSGNPYTDLDTDATALAARIETMLAAAGLRQRLADHAVQPADVEKLAASAAEQWTARFNPRPVDQASFREIYKLAL
jgi:alcohol dehydrogenase